MSFAETIAAWPEERLRGLYRNIGPADVEAALKREDRSLADLAALFSPAARPYLEPMAREGQRLTRWHFGRTISLYAPIYISNICTANCPYCGFSVSAGGTAARVTLTPDEIAEECRALAAMGYQNILLLTGEAPKAVPVVYIAEAVAIARRFFAGVSVEIYALEEAGYRQLCEAGLEGVTVYQETYHRATYETLHRRGRKKDYLFRLDAPERAGNAGVRRISIGALLGLCDWRTEMLRLGMHGRHLQKHCWQSALNISFPRLRHTPDGFEIRHPVSDADLVQIMLALRLFLPEAGFNLSTRETPALRDNLIPLGVTAMSAGSSTRPGGYATHTADTREQFAIDDTRPPAEVVAAIRRAGYDPVWKDFDSAFIE
jgi:2-iminoacetate synthase